MKFLMCLSVSVFFLFLFIVGEPNPVFGACSGTISCCQSCIDCLCIKNGQEIDAGKTCSDPTKCVNSRTDGLSCGADGLGKCSCFLWCDIGAGKTVSCSGTSCTASCGTGWEIYAGSCVISSTPAPSCPHMVDCGTQNCDTCTQVCCLTGCKSIAEGCSSEPPPSVCSAPTECGTYPNCSAPYCSCAYGCSSTSCSGGVLCLSY
jgi:hypothetical protein